MNGENGVRIRNVDDLRQLAVELRRERGMTQDEVAGLSGFSKKWLSDFERGRITPPVSMVLDLLNSYGVEFHVGLPRHVLQEEPEETVEIDSERGLSF